MPSDAVGYPARRLFHPLRDREQLATGYDIDEDYPTVTGAWVMGQVLRDAINPHLPDAAPKFVTTANESDAGVIFLNGCCRHDGDGIPDGGYTSQTLGFWSPTGNGVT